MKGRYAGRHMTVYGSIIPGTAAIARSALLTGNLSQRAQQRLKILDWCRAHGNNLSLTARRFSIHRRMLRQWRERLVKEGPRGLENRSRRPHRVRQPVVSPDTVMEVVKRRKQYPAWSKYKIQPLLPESLTTSVSTVGRILKRRGLIEKRVSLKRRKAALHPKRRYPHGLKIASPGDLIQMDTKHILLPGGDKWYQFTAIDVLTKQRVLAAYSSESSRHGALFLDQCRSQFPFPIRATQTDNGAPWQKEFERRCSEIGLTHYFIQPRSPRQNSYVEISHGADEREFYARGNACMLLVIMRQRLAEWQRVWNEVRPHQALNYLTPKQYYEKWQRGRLPSKDVITLQT